MATTYVLKAIGLTSKAPNKKADLVRKVATCDHLLDMLQYKKHFG